MNVQQFRESKEYADACKKINAYHKGFEFTIPYYKMTQGQRNAMDVVTTDCTKQGLIQSVSVGVSLEGEFTEETFVRL